MLRPVDNQRAIRSLRREFNMLAEQQIEALKTATFVGMTGEQAKEYDARQRRINDLANKLARLSKEG